MRCSLTCVRNCGVKTAFATAGAVIGASVSVYSCLKAIEYSLGSAAPYALPVIVLVIIPSAAVAGAFGGIIASNGVANRILGSQPT